MNKNTTNSSFVLSRWKHVVKTSSSVAFSQMGRLYERQKDLVQSAQVRVWWGLGLSLAVEDLMGMLSSSEEGASRGMIVEFVKQVLRGDVSRARMQSERMRSVPFTERGRRGGEGEGQAGQE